MPGHTSIPTEDDPYIGLRAASRLGYGSYSTLRRYIAAGRLEAHYIGPRIVLRRADLEALVTPAPTATPSRPADDDIDAAVRRIVAAAPALSPEQVRQLSAVLGAAA